MMCPKISGHSSIQTEHASLLAEGTVTTWVSRIFRAGRACIYQSSPLVLVFPSIPSLSLNRTKKGNLRMPLFLSCPNEAVQLQAPVHKC